MYLYIILKTKTNNIMEKLTVNGVNYVPEFKTNDYTILAAAIGKYCIVRTRNEGINCGRVIAADHTGVVIEDARRLYYHRPRNKNMAWYEGVSQSGVSDDSKLSTTVYRKYIIEDYSLTICSDIAEQNLRTHEDHKTSI